MSDKKPWDVTCDICGKTGDPEKMRLWWALETPFIFCRDDSNCDRKAREMARDKKFPDAVETTAYRITALIHKLLKKAGVKHPNEQLVDDYWDCECDDSYINTKHHPPHRDKGTCFTCKTDQDDQPDSRLIEVVHYLIKPHLEKVEKERKV